MGTNRPGRNHTGRFNPPQKKMGCKTSPIHTCDKIREHALSDFVRIEFHAASLIDLDTSQHEGAAMKPYILADICEFT
ncbi:MAG: hypothetical protein EON54_27535 [Alcaligenaceae bacterium]|nr:MAG: hypothetical protein EON54_27535 [Alcaligenaceae bacterium]